MRYVWVKDLRKKRVSPIGSPARTKLGSNLGPNSAEYPLKPHYKTQNQAKRFNKLDYRNCFGTRGSEVQILSPRPIFSSTYISSALASEPGAALPSATVGFSRDLGRLATDAWGIQSGHHKNIGSWKILAE